MTSGKRLIASAAALALAAAGCGGSHPGPASKPLPFTSLAAASNRILDGGPSAFKAQLAQLRGHPVVVNQWASWCGPCRFEFGYFRAVARKYDTRVAFLGVDANDSRSAARGFLRREPTPYPHFYDQSSSIARTFGGGRAWPTTAFFDAAGKLRSTHFGPYTASSKLERDIRTYALRG